MELSKYPDTCCRTVEGTSKTSVLTSLQHTVERLKFSVGVCGGEILTPTGRMVISKSFLHAA